MFLIESVNGLYCDCSALLRNFSIINCICSFLDLSSDSPLCVRTVADMKTNNLLYEYNNYYYYRYNIIKIVLIETEKPSRRGGRKNTGNYALPADCAAAFMIETCFQEKGNYPRNTWTERNWDRLFRE